MECDAGFLKRNRFELAETGIVLVFEEHSESMLLSGSVETRFQEAVVVLKELVERGRLARGRLEQFESGFNCLVDSVGPVQSWLEKSEDLEPDECPFFEECDRFSDACWKLLPLVQEATNGQPILGIVLDKDLFELRWNLKSCPLSNGQEFRLMRALIDTRGRYVETEILADRLGASALRSIKHIVSRLKKDLRKAGMDQLADAILAETGHYGFFPPPEIVTVL